MINLINAQISFGTRAIYPDSDLDYLDVLSRENLIEKRENGTGKSYYYAESIADNMRFRIFITLKGRKIDWIRLHWLDSTMKGWDDVSERAVTDEYRILLNLVEKMLGRPPDNKKNRQRTWHLKWGELNVSYDLRAFQADIYMKLKHGRSMNAS